MSAKNQNSRKIPNFILQNIEKENGTIQKYWWKCFIWTATPKDFFDRLKS